jgi:cobalt/nickel transport system permease protein
MIDEPFAEGSSFLHRADPRAKLALAVALACTLAVCTGWRGPVLGLCAGMVLVVWARLRWRPFWRRMLTINGFVAFLWVFLPFTTPANPWPFGPLDITAQGIAASLLISLKTNAISLCFLSLVATRTRRPPGAGMHRLHVPDKLVFLFLFTYRIIHVLNDERLRRQRPRACGAFAPEATPTPTAPLASLLAMVLVGACVGRK